MTPTPFSFTVSLLATIIVSLTTESDVVTALGSASTVAVTFGTGTVCGIIAGDPTQKVQCYQKGLIVSVLPNVSFEAISGGRTFFCGLRSGGSSIHCWETQTLVNSSSFRPKRIYSNYGVPLTDLAVGDDHVCAREVGSGIARCWRGKGGSAFPSPGIGLKFRGITSGSGFSCGILRNDSRVICWGANKIGVEIQRQFGNLSMSSLVAGDSHACGLTTTEFLVCKGNNDTGQLDVTRGQAFEFSGLSLGRNFSCGIRRRNGLVLCWGGGNTSRVADVSFESIVGGLDFICGLTTRNLTLICWGNGWFNSENVVPLGMVIPGPCVQSSCNCGTYLNSETLCYASGNICKPCRTELPIPVPLTPILPPSPSQGSLPFSQSSKGINKLSLAFFIVGSIGAFAGICTIIYSSHQGLYRFLLCRTHNPVQPTVADANIVTAVVDNNDSIAPPLRSFSIRRNSSRRLVRQRSGSSSSKQAERTQNFSFSELANASNNFSIKNRIGSGSFGVVYKGKLQDGRQVAIKRGESETSAHKVKKFQEKETAFESELALLSRLHHKHLVGLVGFCHENDERLLVYEYMSNGSLYDHLHNKDNIKKSSSIVNSWRMRIKIALDAARGIHYLHNYAMPPIIHRDIKSSNILLDANWTARVSDFGLSLMGPESDQEFMSTGAVGTVGYIDPEYYVLNVLTPKSDIYGFGVVLLELLTGKRAVFRNKDGSGPIGVFEYATPRISNGDLRTVLDTRIGVPEAHEAEAVELMAHTAINCVNLEGKERPNMTDIVANLEKALTLCENSPASLSSATMSLPSD
ncbi:putative serine/threonine-protein kinase-like protein CCR3 [Hibiscus syriacus]|uniref:non-specific serine/threonine protein kinase n=1 Tax=Hibiscus syriacus TaxID=106335 RepID=A0A6A2YD20_HIBSY|nr:putative serine/threonine-protein kinase-like protein CCR3 [Hibiscus syriacus]KAE8676396.1 putative serine/threonine-protein kinase-like protein CCR3 [Hibiscus syriacus]